MQAWSLDISREPALMTGVCKGSALIGTDESHLVQGFFPRSASQFLDRVVEGWQGDRGRPAFADECRVLNGKEGTNLSLVRTSHVYQRPI